MKKHLLAFSLVFFSLYTGSLFSKDLPALLYRVKGAVEVLPGDVSSPQWKPAKPGMGLAKKDRIKTGPASTAQILLSDGSFCQVREKSVFEIEELIYDAKSRSQQSSLKVWSGTLLSRVQKLQKGSDAKFRTPTALVAVRGTELGLDVAEDGTTDLALYDGKIVVKDFVEESGLPQRQDDLLLQILHEVSINAGQGSKIDKEGVSRPKKIGAGSFQKPRLV